MGDDGRSSHDGRLYELVNIKKLLYEKFLKDLLKQAEDGAPVEAMGFMVHPMDAPDMPTIEHRHGKERPKWLQDELDLDGWEPLQ